MQEALEVNLSRAECSPTDRAKLNNIFAIHSAVGFTDEQECIRVALTSCSFLGRPYLQSLELREDTIDCSTLTSQAHWLGAIQQIPLIAENQRTASAGLTVDSNFLPGDVVVKYRNLSATPDQLHNHVALVLGRDSDDALWLIESSSANEVHIVRVDDFAPFNCVRRFCENPLTSFSSESALAALRLAQMVSKQGRVGALRCPETEDRHFRLPGIDIRTEPGAVVSSPIDGELRIVDLGYGRWLEVKEPTGKLTCLLGNCRPIPALKLPLLVSRGQMVGCVEMPETSPWDAHSCVLYFEMSSAEPMIFGNEVGPKILSNYQRRGERYCHNALYMAKIDLIGLPLRI